MDTRVLLVFVTSIICVVCVADDSSVSVETNVGTIVGFQKEMNVFGGRVNVSMFLGIPYAEPPVGELRFEKPVPKAAFTSPFIAKQHGNICFQQHRMPTAKVVRDSEDCLFLNVYAPMTSSSSGGLPVMIWIHGGSFTSGSADVYAGDTLAGFGDVIVVTLNYRLSIWGFFSTSVHTGPKNYGLWDQHLAIRWVHDNIAAFGGDTNRVTIFGESAGAGSVVYQSLYEGNRGLFQRVIAQSGSIGATWASTTDPDTEARKLGCIVGCESDEPVTLHDCIKSTPAELLNSTVNNASNGFIRFPMPFIPVLDGEFVRERREDIFEINSDDTKHELFTTLDLMMGMVSAEGTNIIKSVSKGDPENFHPNRAYFEETVVPEFIKPLYDPNVPEAVIVATIAQYTDWSDPECSEKIRENIIQLCSDLIMTGTIMKTIDFHADHSVKTANTYLYELDVNPSYHFLPTPSWLKKANHGDELLYLFGFSEDGILSVPMPDETPKFEQWEIQLSKDMITWWTNFAKSGNPNEPTSFGQEWPQYNQARQHYFDIAGDISPHSVKQYLFARNANFWNKVIPSIMNGVHKLNESGEQSSHFAERKATCDKEAGCSP